MVTQPNGDLKITMTQELANNLQDAIIQGSTCPVEHPSLAKRVPDYGCLTSGGINVIINAQPNMRLADLVVMIGLRAPAFRNLAAEAARALTEIIDFARNAAPDLEITPAAAEEFGKLVFAIVYDAIALGVELGPELVFKAAEWTAGTSSACATSTTATVGEVACTMINKIFLCQSKYDETTGCSVTDSLTTVWAPMPTYNLPSITPAPSPICFN